MQIRKSEMQIRKNLLKLKKSKNEVELALEEALKGEVKEWNSVDDYFKTILSE